MTIRRTREQMAQCVARDIPDGSTVNLGIGMPVLVLPYWNAKQEIIVHSENGILGMRALADGEAADPDVVNAAKQPVALESGGAYFHHADSFAMMRGGHLDYCVLGGYQVSASGDLANWSLGQPGVAAAVGGAMDLAVGAKQVYVLMEHQTREGQSRLLRSCTLPLTGLGCVKRVYTDLATLDVADGAFVVRDMVPGLTATQLQAATDAPLRFL
ncbi:3-oxoacid CoA-transferase, B subunit [Variovorax sp. CF313]|jgi:3-oxoadipate CoA-transferase beta subunit|uniref:3-oxoacid CoA-transferase subunit B n=1 Tax=Variovorax sp. CF313 TaxID=1144315 RepID=UPI0002714E50|nr:3-oxoacid CoA-transferase subunit B [Variovorax sp. CF313]EJL67585.1 3-oxoacid CoA-transferase, B subunit [Variovorax sp. CF313]